MGLKQNICGVKVDLIITDNDDMVIVCDGDKGQQEFPQMEPLKGWEMWTLPNDWQ